MLSRLDAVTLEETYPVLRCMATEQREGFARMSDPVAAASGQTLLAPGGSCYSVLLISSGSIRVSRLAACGREVVLYRVAPGDLCPLTVTCLLGGRAYPARATVERTILGCSLSREFLVSALQVDSFREFLFCALGRHAAALLMLVEEIAFHGVAARVASLLARSGSSLCITHRVLADEIGSTREVVSRTLEQFAAQNLVRLERGRIHIIDSGGIGRVAQLGSRR